MTVLPSTGLQLERKDLEVTSWDADQKAAVSAGLSSGSERVGTTSWGAPPRGAHLGLLHAQPLQPHPHMFRWEWTAQSQVREASVQGHPGPGTPFLEHGEGQGSQL